MVRDIQLRDGGHFVKDRISTQIIEVAPGVFARRYADYSESGEFLGYRWMALADDPLEDGTPISKATLLADETETAMWGNPANRTINQALARFRTSVHIGSAGGDPIYPQAVELGSLPVGTRVYGIEKDNPDEGYFVMQHGYPSAGNGGTLLRRVGISTESFYFSENFAPRNYEDGPIDAYLNSDYLSSLVSNVVSAIPLANVPIIYRIGPTSSQTTGAKTISRKAFIHSAKEAVNLGTNNDGYFLAAYVSGTVSPAPAPNDNATRTFAGTTNYYTVTPTVSVTHTPHVATPARIFPMFTLPADFTLYTDGATYTATQQYAGGILTATDILGNDIGGFTKMETGSYLGTGTLGASNKNSLAFPFAPAVVGIVANQAAAQRVGTIIIRGQTSSAGIGVNDASASSLYLNINWDGNTVTWYSTQTPAAKQLNENGTTYFYFALG